jgi:hypothetical protein
MRRHPTAPVNVARISVATSGTDFTAPEGDFTALIRPTGICPGRSQVAGAKLAVDGQVKDDKVAPRSCDFQANANGPDVLRFERSGAKRTLTCHNI